MAFGPIAKTLNEYERIVELEQKCVEFCTPTVIQQPQIGFTALSKQPTFILPQIELIFKHPSFDEFQEYHRNHFTQGNDFSTEISGTLLFKPSVNQHLDRFALPSNIIKKNDDSFKAETGMIRTIHYLPELDDLVTCLADTFPSFDPFEHEHFIRKHYPRLIRQDILSRLHAEETSFFRFPRVRRNSTSPSSMFEQIWYEGKSQSLGDHSLQRWLLLLTALQNLGISDHIDPKSDPINLYLWANIGNIVTNSKQHLTSSPLPPFINSDAGVPILLRAYRVKLVATPLKFNIGALPEFGSKRAPENRFEMRKNQFRNVSHQTCLLKKQELDRRRQKQARECLLKAKRFQ